MYKALLLLLPPTTITITTTAAQDTTAIKVEDTRAQRGANSSTIRVDIAYSCCWLYLHWCSSQRKTTTAWSASSARMVAAAVIAAAIACRPATTSAPSSSSSTCQFAVHIIYLYTPFSPLCRLHTSSSHEDAIARPPPTRARLLLLLHTRYPVYV